MILNLEYTVTFPDGVTLSGKFQPLTGLTAVVGPNGSGKTFGTMELARYLLYGKKALRGAAPDYKKLDAKGEFQIQGAVYAINRSWKREELLDAAGTVLAVGADAVTAKATELMGYGLAVFDVANASVQKEADLFGKMLPSERKRLIDEVVGLTSNEQAEKACRDESNGLKREAEALTRTLRAPEEPVEPEGYEPSGPLSEELDKLRTLQKKADALIANIRPAFEPEKPDVKRYTQDRLDELEAYEQRRRANRQEYLRLEQIAERAFVRSDYTEEELDAAEKRLELGEQIECPSCNHRFYSTGASVLSDTAPVLTRSQISEARLGLKVEAEVVTAVEAQAEIEKQPSREDELIEARRSVIEWQNYDKAIERIGEQLELNREAERALRELGPLPGQNKIDEMAERLLVSRFYEKTFENFYEAKKAYDELLSTIEHKTQMAAEYRKGSEALSDARATLKQYLTPALSREATRIIGEMTNGVLQSIVIDEDMEITANGKRIETLSGGYETVVNIAIRVALGKVLVSQTFSVFMGDEMDAHADDLRRQAVIQALTALSKEFKQVILITHKGVDTADHVYDLGNT